MDRTRIPPAFRLDASKLDYLLRPRAKYDNSKFLARAGFSAGHPEALEAAIRSGALSGDAICDRTNEFGEFYSLRLVWPDRPATFSMCG